MYDDAPELGWQLSAPDVAVVDISAMVYDRLAANKPLLVTRPVSTEAEIASVVFYGAGWQGQNNVYADNLSFDTRDLPTVVPLPAAAVLLASGMAAFAWARRRSGRTGACRNAEN